MVGATNDRADSWPVRAYLKEMLVLRAAEAAGAVALVAYQVVSSHEHKDVVLSFLSWADQRLFTRGRA